MNTAGVVSAVTPSLIAIKVKADEVQFVADKDTAVMAKGGHYHKSLALKADGKSTVLTDFVKAGDTVTIGVSRKGQLEARGDNQRQDTRRRSKARTPARRLRSGAAKSEVRAPSRQPATCVRPLGGGVGRTRSRRAEEHSTSRFLVLAGSVA